MRSQQLDFARSVHARGFDASSLHGRQQSETIKLLDALPHADSRRWRSTARSQTPTRQRKSFFGMSRATLRHQSLAQFLPPGSPLFSLIDQVMNAARPSTNIASNWACHGSAGERIVDIFVSPLAEGDEGVVIMLQERTID